MAEEQKDGLMSEEVGKSVTAIPLDIDPERYKAMELRLQEVIPEGAYELYMKSDSDISEEYADVREEDPEAFDAVLRVNTDVNRQAMDRSQFSVDEAVADSPIPEIDTYLMENSVYLNTIPPGFERKKDLNARATAHVIPESPTVDRTQRGQLPGLSENVEQQDSVRLHETVHASGVMGEYDSLTTKLLAETVGDESSAEAATTGLDLYRAISRDDPIAARQSINYLLKQKVNLYLYRDELIDNMMRAIDVLEETSDGGIELSPERKIEIRKDIEKEFKNIPRILENMRLERAGEKEPPKMDEGGLMADPLVLSETAEEEAAPKMGIGEYIEGAIDIVTDFSPAGTAQSMIDAAEEAYKLASGAEDASFMDFGIAAIGALPGGKTATKVVDNASKIADEIAEASLEISKLDNYVPKKTVKAYKLFTKGEDDNLYPLFVDANKPLPVGEWIKANMPDYIFQAKNGRYYVPSKATAPKTETGKKAFYDTGERKATGSSVEIPDDPELRKKLVEAGFIAKEGTKSVKAVAARPGWHAGDVPIAHHIGAMIDPATGGTKKLEMPNVRRDDQVWAEVELPADVDWQQEALRRANVKKDGEIDVGTAHITDMVPHGGSYRYKTNPNMTGEWLIGGELKINRVLSDDEVKAINNAAGVEDLPRYSEFMDQYVKAPTETGLMSAEGAAKKSPAVDMAINVRVDKKADLDYAEKLISGEKVYETRNSRSLDPYIGQRVGIAKTGDGKAQAIGSVEIGEPIEVDEKTFRKLQDKHLVPQGSAFDVPEGGKKYLYPVSNPERFESPKDVGRGIVSRKIVNKYAGGLMSDEYNRAEL